VHPKGTDRLPWDNPNHLPVCFFHVLTARSAQPCGSISREKGAQRDQRGQTVRTDVSGTGHVAQENIDHNHVAAERDGTRAQVWQAMLAGPRHPRLWLGCWFPEGNLSLWLRELDLGPKQRGMLSAGSRELGGSVSAAMWLCPSDSLWFGLRGKTLRRSFPLV